MLPRPFTLSASLILQVSQNHGYISCCAVVKNCKRNIFVVPNLGIFAGPTLDELEDAYAADPNKKKDLITHLHVSADPITSYHAPSMFMFLYL